MELSFVKASPCENTTLFIEGDLPQDMRAFSAARAMSPIALCAEQAGFLTAPLDSRAVMRVEMTGGEFCGNATAALAALAVRRGLAGEGVPFYVECSGAEHPVRAEARRSGAVFFARVAFDMRPELERAKLDVTALSVSGVIARLPGICHFLTDTTLTDGQYRALTSALIDRVQSEAYGIISYKSDGGANAVIKPFVSVPKAGSCVYERACGSGSIALAWLLHESCGLARFEIAQAGGVITAEIGAQSTISEEVLFTCEGKILL